MSKLEGPCPCTQQGKDFLRQLTRCVTASGEMTQYTLGNGCSADGYDPQVHLGYVR